MPQNALSDLQNISECIGAFFVNNTVLLMACSQILLNSNLDYGFVPHREQFLIITNGAPVLKYQNILVVY